MAMAVATEDAALRFGHVLRIMASDANPMTNVVGIHVVTAVVGRACRPRNALRCATNLVRIRNACRTLTFPVLDSALASRRPSRGRNTHRRHPSRRHNVSRRFDGQTARSARRQRKPRRSKIALVSRPCVQDANSIRAQGLSAHRPIQATHRAILRATHQGSG